MWLYQDSLSDILDNICLISFDGGGQCDQDTKDNGASKNHSYSDEICMLSVCESEWVT